MTAVDTADRDLARRVLIEELYAVPPPVRQRSHWVMDGEMWRMLSDLFAPQSPPWAMPAPSGGIVLLGRPVELRAGVEGVQFVADDA